jgi:hypothetical protein
MAIIVKKSGLTFKTCGRGCIMKHTSQIFGGGKSADAVASNDQAEPNAELVADVDSIIGEIQARANYVGPVLEEILHTPHERMNWDV